MSYASENESNEIKNYSTFSNCFVDATNNKKDDFRLHLFSYKFFVYIALMCLGFLCVFISTLFTPVSLFDSFTSPMIPKSVLNSSDGTDLSQWKLIWSDEFHGSNINFSIWSIQDIDGQSTGNNELELYMISSKNCYINTTTHQLTLKAMKVSPPILGYDYTSCRMTTEGKKTFLYGRILARVRAPKGQGIWPAFWMLGKSIRTSGWPYCGEIDIFEMVGGKSYWHGGDNKAWGSFHWNGGDESKNFVTPKGSILNDEYIVAAIEWDENEIRMYVDNNMFHRFDISKTAQQADPGLLSFHQPFFFIMNLAVGGMWPGPPNYMTPFPSYFHIDYIRVYKRKQLAKMVE